MASTPRRPERGIQTVERAGGAAYRVQVIRKGRTWLDETFETLTAAREARARAIAQASDASAGWVAEGAAVGKMLLTDAFDVMLQTQQVATSTAENDALRVGVLKERWPKKKVADLSGADLRQLMDDWLAPDPDELEGLTEEQVRAAKAGRKSQASIRQYLSLVSKTYKTLARTRDYPGPNPAQHVVWPSIDRALHHEDRYIPDAELSLILRTMRRLETEGWIGAHGVPCRLKPGSTTLFGFLSTAGTRLSEALRLTVRGAKAEYLSVNITKNSHSRTIPRIPAVDRLLTRRLEEMADYALPDHRLWHEPNEPHTPMDSRWAWMVVMRELGLDYRRHDLRHTATSNLFLKTDLRDQEISAVTGHRGETLARYVHLRSARLGQRAAAIGAELEF